MHFRIMNMYMLFFDAALRNNLTMRMSWIAGFSQSSRKADGRAVVPMSQRDRIVIIPSDWRWSAGTLLPGADGRRDLATTGSFRQSNYSMRRSLDRQIEGGLW